MEDQATDRAFRIGQAVLVHKCVTLGTLEEKIDALISQKRDLATKCWAAAPKLNITAMSDAEILRLVQLDVQRATGDYVLRVPLLCICG